LYYYFSYRLHAALYKSKLFFLNAFAFSYLFPPNFFLNTYSQPTPKCTSSSHSASTPFCPLRVSSFLEKMGKTARCLMTLFVHDTNHDPSSAKPTISVDENNCCSPS